MSDAICPACAGDNLTDYPVCDGCATVAHFTHRDRCIHCVRKRAATMQQEQITAILTELVAADADDPRLVRIRLRSLAKRAAALLAAMEENGNIRA